MVEVAAAQDQAAVEAVAAERPYPAFGIGVRVRRLHRRLDDVDRFAAEDLVEAAAELACGVRKFGSCYAVVFMNQSTETISALDLFRFRCCQHS